MQIGQLLHQKRMFYSEQEPINSLIGLKMMIDEIVKPDFKMVEVGCFAGISSELFAKFCKEIICIDIWDTEDPAYAEIEKENLAKAFEMFQIMAEEYPNLSFIREFSTIAATYFDIKTLDMVYIDANHAKEKVKEDIRAWWPKVKFGGWLAGHDIWYIYVKEAVEELLGTNYKTYPDTSWAIQKQPGMYLK